MYAIIEVAGKQYKVSAGSVFYSDSFGINEGTDVSFKVLAKCNDSGFEAGSPCLSATVTAKAIKNGKRKKIVVFKYKAKKNYKRKRGHRQSFTKWEVASIS